MINEDSEPIDALVELIKQMGELISITKDGVEQNERILKLAESNNERWERTNPKKGEEPIYDWATVSLAPGYAVTFYIDVPEGFEFHCENISATFLPDSTYLITLDSISEPLTSEVVCDFGDHWPYFDPPKIIKARAQITITNLNDVTQEYSTFFGGFLRQSE